ncbi:MAG TPA: hypothetical protein VF981_05365 [Gemmatimonadaceae bacterium]
MRTRSRRLVLAAALTACVVGRASAQSPPTSLSQASRDTLRRLADSTRAMGLPTEPLLAKAAEGALKGASDARVLHAVRTLMRELHDARAALAPGASTGTLVAAASALHAGVSREGIGRVALAREASDGDLGLAFVTLADLVANGVPVTDATTAIVDLVSRRAGEAELTVLRLGVARDVGTGRTPADALQTYTSQLLKALERKGGD